MLKRHVVFIAFAAVALAAVGCSDAPESGRAVGAVSNINGGIPVSSSVSSGADDVITMEFRFRPYNTLLDISETTPYGDIIIERYVITWSNGAIASREEITSFFLSVYEPASYGVRLVTAAEKGSVAVPASLVAHIDFFAREMGTDSEIEFSTDVTVNFTS
jgi:hypothetical protein